jgi:hypothetical protein
MDRLKSTTGKTIYPIMYGLTDSERAWLGLIFNKFLNYEDLKTGKTVKVGAIKTGEKRPPKAGEWYISGAIPEAYRQPHDSTISMQIARLVAYEIKTTYRIINEG